jgi:heme-binding HmuY-like protein
MFLFRIHSSKNLNKKIMKRSFIVIAMLAASIFLVSCEKEKTEIPVVLQTKTVNDLPADPIIGISPQGQPYGSGVFTLYSLENNRIVPNSDSATNKWDLGFRGTTIITNGGTSGPAIGGAFVYTGIFGDLSQVPADSTFKIDNAPTSYAITIGSDKGWYHYDGATQLVTPIPGRVLVIRTASGKYAKVEILNYYKGGITPDASASDNEKLSKQRYYTFRYIYQVDGTKEF